MVKKLVVCVDGVGFDLLNQENIPFLYNFAKNNFLARSKTMFSFFGLEYSFFSGKSPLEHNNWLEFKYSKRGDFYWQKYFSFFGRGILNYMTALFQYVSGQKMLSKIYYIPFSLLPYLKVAQKNSVYDTLFFQGSYLSHKWPVVVKNGKSSLIFRKQSDRERCEYLKNHFSNNIDTYYVHIVEFDKIAHKYGHKSLQATNILKYYDQILSDLVKNFLSKFPKGDVLLWSDHSFVKIENKVDLTKIFKCCKDYDCFIAGTSISFWFKTQQGKAYVLEKLKGFDFGYILDERLRKKELVPFSNVHGDLIFAIKKGNYLFPNYYQGDKSFNYMHGYPYSKEQDGFVISSKTLKKKEYYLFELTPLLFGGED